MPGSGGLACYGVGNGTTWSVQANATVFAALATLATAPDLDESRNNREALRATALQLLGFILATHKSGPLATPCGRQWGHSWITVLSYTRMLHALPPLRPFLREADLLALERVLLSECDFLLTGYPVAACIEGASGRNKPESNLWNGAILYRAAALFPHAPNAALYRQRSTELLLNAISIPQDAASLATFRGKPLRDWHVGPNFTEEFGLNHHRYLNVGYMVICLSNIAMAYYACEDEGITPPPELFHHARELWQLVKSLTFADGRLWRIGGDNRVRYGYCQDYAIPVWLLAYDLWGDADAAQYLDGWLNQVETEQRGNADGGFLTARLAGLAQLSPLYYCRLEGDRAGTLSMAVRWTQRIVARALPTTPTPVLETWSDAFHGASMVRGKRLASWVWKGVEGPAGMVVPAHRSDLAEWEWNLAGRVVGAGCLTRAEPEAWASVAFPRGFLTHGSFHWIADLNPSEGSPPEQTARCQIVFAALPDDATVLVLQRATTTQPVYLNQVAGLGLRIPNDLFNGSKRRYRFLGAGHEIPGASTGALPTPGLLEAGDQIEVDGQLTITALYGGTLAILRPGHRQITLRNTHLQHSQQGGSLYCDEVIVPITSRQQFYPAGTRLYDIGANLCVGGAAQGIVRSSPHAEVRIIEGVDRAGWHYLLAVNFGPVGQVVALPAEAKAARTLCGPPPENSPSGETTLSLPPESSSLLQLG